MGTRANPSKALGALEPVPAPSVHVVGSAPDGGTTLTEAPPDGGPRGVAQLGSASALGAEGRWFESSHPDTGTGADVVVRRGSPVVRHAPGVPIWKDRPPFADGRRPTCEENLMTTPDPYTPGTPEPGATPPGGTEPQQPAPGQPAPGQASPAQPAGGQPHPASPQAPGQAYPAAPPAGQYAPAYGQPPQNPGKTLGIVGLVLGFFGPLSIVGLILSIVGLVKSRKAGQPNGVAIAGIIVSSLVLIGTIIVAVVIGVGVGYVLEQCAELGPGTHVVGNTTFTCPS
ncbi:hypothetical protein GCM10027054_16720 [Isoptericola nanjingensis]